jgi:hypothetical protein
MNQVSRRNFLNLFGACVAVISGFCIKPLSGFSASCRKKYNKAAKPNLDCEKRAELRKLLRGMRSDLRRCKEELIAHKRAGKEFGHLAELLHKKQQSLRNYHIALSELRGKERSQIERPLRGHPPCENTIAQIKIRFS